MVEKKQKEFVDMTVKELTKLMSGPSQIKRKNAAKELLSRVHENPENFKAQIPDFVDALSRPEAQTRWEALDALTLLVPIDAKACKSAIDGAEEALFDDKTSLIRESAIRFLSRYGASSVQRSKEVWPLIKDALQQYHGEIDYDKMLNRVLFFASGKLDANVKKDCRACVKDIYNSVGGSTKARLNRILLALKGKTDIKPKASAKKVADKKPEVKKSVSKKKEKPKTKSAAKPASSKKTTAKKSEKKPEKKAAKKVDKKSVKKTAKKVEKKPTKKSVKKTEKKPIKKAEKKSAKKPVKKVVKKAEKKQAKKQVKKVEKKTIKKQVKKAAKKK